MNYSITEIQNERKYMEDRTLVFELFNNIWIYCIFDGHNGHHVAEYLKYNIFRLFKSNMSEELLNNKTDINIHFLKMIIKDIFFKIDREIYEYLYSTKDQFKERFQSYMEIGSCSLICIVTHNAIYSINLGDSRALLVFDDFNVKALTVDHKACFFREQGLIIANGGNIECDRVEGCLAVTRAFGDFSLKKYLLIEPEITITERHINQKYIIIASDGLWDVIENHEMSTIIKNVENDELSPQELSNFICDTAIERKSIDNISCIIVELK